MFTLPPRVKETSNLRSHFYIVDTIKQYESFVKLLNGKYLVKGFRGRSQKPIYCSELFKFLKCELFLYLGFKLNNFHSWIQQILPFYSKVDTTIPMFIANVNYEYLVENNYHKELIITYEKDYKYKEFEEISFIEHINTLFNTNIHVLLNNEFFAINKLYKSSKFMNVLQQTKYKKIDFSTSLITITPQTIINMHKLKQIPNNDINTLLPSLNDWICYEYIRHIFNLEPSKYGKTIDRTKYGMIDISQFKCVDE